MLRKVKRPHAGRIVQERMKRPVADEPNVEERRHHARLRLQGCAVCGHGPVHIHHILTDIPAKRVKRDHRFVVGLCAFHHNGGKLSVHGLGSEALFEEATGVDIVKQSVAEWDASQCMADGA